jgi:hypothetical protein
MLRKNVATQFLCFGGVNATTGAALTGATFSGRRCLDGTFAAIGATITEDTGIGFYKVALTQADTNGNDCAYFFTATNAVPVCLNAITTAADPTDTVRFGLTALPNVASGSAGALIVSGTGTAALSVSSGLVTLAGVTHTGAVIPTVTTTTTATNLTNLPAITANWLTAAGTAADFGAELATAVWTDTTAGDFTVPVSVGKSVMNGVALGTGLTIAAVSGAVGSVTGAVGSVTGAVGSVTGNVGGNVVGSVGLVTGAVGSVTGNVGGSVGSVTGAVGSVTGLTAADVGAIKAKTDSLTYTVANVLDANVQRINDVTITGNGQVGTEFGV